MRPRTNLSKQSVWPTLLFVSVAVSSVPGCGRDKLTAPSYSPDQAAKQALAEYDTNHDGYLDAKELERCPALKKGLEYLDQDGDGRLSAGEIAAQLSMYQQSGVALKARGCRVFMDGKPLQGATVTYVPEKFLASSIKPASGVTDAHGSVLLSIEGEQVAGVQPGFYRVQVSRKNAKGEEMIPARYNQDTILGEEVSPRRKALKLEKLDEEDGVFRLTSKSK